MATSLIAAVYELRAVEPSTPTPTPTALPTDLAIVPPVPVPTVTVTADPVQVVSALELVPAQWQYIAVALCIVVFACGVMLAVKI